jgi:hypothetical protein
MHMKYIDRLARWFRTTQAAAQGTPGLQEAIASLQQEQTWIAHCSLVMSILESNDYFKHELCLHRYGYKVYSQNEEDGLLRRIFENVGYTNRYFVEFGSGEGFENNSIYLLLNGWTGVWIEGSPECASIATRYFHRFVENKRLRILNEFVSPQNIENLFQDAGVPDELDLLSIDIDGNDYWVWQAVSNFRPRVVVIEYNAGLGPIAEWVMTFNPNHRWTGSRNFGASLKSLEILGKMKAYMLVGCNLTGSNAFFVRSDLGMNKFLSPFDSETHYQPPRYYLRFFPGHPIDPGEVESFPV